MELETKNFFASIRKVNRRILSNFRILISKILQNFYKINRILKNNYFLNIISKNKIFKSTLITLIIFNFYNINKIQAKDDKTSTSLYYIEGKYFKVVFEGEAYESAQRLLNNLDHFFPYVSNNLGHLKIPKLNVLLKNRNSITNAAVETYPRRMCIFYHYPQLRNINGNIDWIDLVCLHESRHVIQNNFYYNQGPNRIVTAFIGTRFPSFEVPNWFSEGDAVFMETILTHGGRGRSPSFSMLFRMNILENNDLSYDKVLNGSLNKQYVNNEYDLGYHLICYLRRNYGSDIIYKIFKKLTKFPYLIYPFDMVIHSETKLYMKDIYNNMIAELKDLWQKQIENLKITKTEIIKTSNNGYIDYLYPQIDGEGNIIVLKQEDGDDKTNKIVLVNKNKGKKLIDIPYINHGNLFSVSKNKITWASSQYKPIWGSDSYCSVIKVYDIKRKTIKQLTKNSVYKAPSLSPSANKIVAVKTDYRGKHNIQILNSNNGKILKTFKNSKNYFLVTPTWSEDEKYIYVIKTANQKNCLVKIEAETEREEIIIPYIKELIERPQIFKNYVFFNSPYNGINNIYSIDLKTNQIYQVTSSKYGSFNSVISKDKDHIIYNDFSKNGMSIVKTDLNPNNWIPIEEVKDRRVFYFDKANKKEELSNFKYVVEDKQFEDKPLDDIPKKYYKKKKLNAIKNLIDLHNIPIWPIDLESNGIEDPQFTIKFKSKNITDTSSLEASFSRYYKKSKNKINFSYKYTGMLPVFEIDFDIEDEKKNEKDIEESENKLIGEFKITPKFYLPFLIRHNYGFTQIIKIGCEFEFKYNIKSLYGFIDSYTPLKFSVGLFKEKSDKDVAPRWGHKFAMSFTEFLNSFAKHKNNELFGMIHLYFPGILKHHSFQILTIGRIRELDNDKHSIPYNFAFSQLAKISNSGANDQHSTIYFTRLSRKLINFHFMYELPLLYPDLALGPLLYITSVNLKLSSSFYIDFVNEDPKGFHKPYFDSIGAWLLFPDIKALRLPMRLKFDLGFGVLFTKDCFVKKSLKHCVLDFHFKTDLLDRF
ncbi:MAG: hypothetical protein GY830_00705 [Bacteroidetes bacterium]|nr:hypothetical protein [Bacteroidota bacterium]